MAALSRQPAPVEGKGDRRLSLQGVIQAVGARGERVRTRALRLLYNPTASSKVGFIVGCGRSGTSMLLAHLGRSWQVEAFNEDHPHAFADYRLRELDTIEALVEESAAPLALFKPILNTTQTGQFLVRFPEAGVVFVFRHYDDVVNSSIKRFGRENRLNHVRDWMSNDFAEFWFAPPPQQARAYIRSLWSPSLGPESGAALYWLFYNRLFYDLGLDEHPRVKLLGYESLVTEPRAEFSSAARFLGIRYEPEMAEGVFATSVQRGPAPKIEEGIRVECERLWLRLLDSAGAAD